MVIKQKEQENQKIKVIGIQIPEKDLIFLMIKVLLCGIPVSIIAALILTFIDGVAELFM